MDPTSGTFVAKKGGPYIFTVTGLSHRSPYSGFEIMHNGQGVAYALDHADEYKLMSQTIILDLVPMDKVWVQLRYSGMYSDSTKFIHFVGHSL